MSEDPAPGGPSRAGRRRGLSPDYHLQALLRHVAENGRICPKPEPWTTLWEMLPSRRRVDGGWDPPLPLILGAWWDTPGLVKMLRLEEHIRYAAAHGVFAKVDRYLRGLREDQWSHSVLEHSSSHVDREAPAQRDEIVLGDWVKDLSRLSAAVENVTRLVTRLETCLCATVAANDVVPSSLPEPLGSTLTALMERLHEVERSAVGIHARHVTDPLGKFAAGRSLTREEYYLIRAMGIEFGTAHQLGLSVVEDFDLLRMLHVEIDREVFYINVSERPRERTDRVSARFGRPPEEVREESLGPEQREFFRRHLPEVSARFLRQARDGSTSSGPYAGGR